MATFKVGQRVKFVADCMPGACAPRVGSEGVINGPWTPHFAGNVLRWDWIVKFDDYTTTCNVLSEEIAPLTDPGADAFMERIKKLKPYDEPKVSVTTEHGTALFPK